ncbi:MAG: RluA family pseudouridine synthase [Chloroflexi bacterium]|nr:RluA family pseudouridine synthase [Chloroflexota bacterium]
MAVTDGEQVHLLEAPVGKRERLDKFLAEQLEGHSRARLQGLIKAGMVQVDGDTVIKPGFGLVGGEEIEVLVPVAEEVGLLAEDIPLDIVFENEDVIVVNKAAGMVVHPAVGHATGTLVNAVLGHAPDIEGVGGELRPGLVHRLDKDTSGLIVLAKNERAQRFLQAQFEAREVEKQYLALVDGRPPTQTGRVEAAIGRDPQERKKMAALPDAKGRAAVSEYRMLETFPKHSLLEVEPRTGRTHQIRVHLAFIGCPVAGDTVYGRRKPTLGLARHFLHAAKLGIKLPGERVMRHFEAPLPEELQEVLNGLQGSLIVE